MAATVAKQYGLALPGTSGTPSATNKYVTDADPRLATVADLETAVDTLESDSTSVEDVIGLCRCDGSIIVPPGGVLALLATTTPVAHSASSMLVWAELPV